MQFVVLTSSISSTSVGERTSIVFFAKRINGNTLIRYEGEWTALLNGTEGRNEWNNEGKKRRNKLLTELMSKCKHIAMHVMMESSRIHMHARFAECWQCVCVCARVLSPKNANLYSYINDDLFVLCVQWRDFSQNSSQQQAKVREISKKYTLEFDSKWILCREMNCQPKINSHRHAQRPGTMTSLFWGRHRIEFCRENRTRA